MDITEYISKKGNNINVIHVPYTSQPQNILQLCDVFCFPSYREGFGYSVIQASALEKPIICSDIYGLKYTCIDNETGFKTQGKVDKESFRENEVCYRKATDNETIWKKRTNIC